MKKRFIGMSVLAAALTLSTGMTAFAGWVPEGDKWAYQYDNGNFAGCGWFTDPETGLQYYLDPDGHMMTGTHVEGYWLDESGVKHEKTQAQIEAEAAREARIASRPSPAKEQLNAKKAAAAAKAATAASSTTRLAYQAEMKTFMDKVFIEIRDQLAKNQNNTIIGDTREDNLENTYFYSHKTNGGILSCSIWKSSNKENANYVPYGFEMTFNRGTSDNEQDNQIMNEGFRKLIVAALGETEGAAAYDQVMAEAVGNGAAFNRSGNTDTGNSYELTYRNNQVRFTVICSEIVPQTEEEAAAAAAAAEKAAEEAAATEQAAAPTSTVIVAGQTSAAAETAAETASETAAETASETAAETDNAAETAAAADTSAEAGEADTAAAGTEA